MKEADFFKASGGDGQVAEIKKPPAENVPAEEDVEAAEAIQSEAVEGDVEIGEASEIEAIEAGVENKENQEPATNEAEKRDVEAHEMYAALNAARNEYVQKDSEMGKNRSMLEKLGAGLNLGNFQEEYNSSFANYQQVLETHKNQLMAECTDKEDAEIVSKFFEADEFKNLENEKMNLKVESSPFSEKIKSGFLSIAEKYRALPTAKKLAIGVSLAGVGFASSVAGGAVATGGAALMGGGKLFSMATSFVGFKGAFEGMAEKKRNAEAQKNVQEATTNEEGEVDMENGEFNFEKLNSILGEKIGGLNEKFQKENYTHTVRTVMAVGATAAMTGIGRYIGGEAMEYVKNHGGIQAVAGHTWDKFWDVVGPNEAGASELPADFATPTHAGGIGTMGAAEHVAPMGGAHHGIGTMGPEHVANASAGVEHGINPMKSMDLGALKELGVTAEKFAQIKEMTLESVTKLSGVADNMSEDGGSSALEKAKILRFLKSHDLVGKFSPATKIGDILKASQIKG